MEERIVITNKEDIDYIEMYKNVYYTKEQVPETMEELGKMASDLAIEKRCKMRYMAGNDGSFFICKDGEMHLFEETREMTVERLYHKLIWLLGE
jgi:hypothetical protein